MENPFSPEIVELILKILSSGNAAEIKKENNKLVVVEIKRQVKSKTIL